MSLINITKKNFEQYDIPCFDLNNPDDKRLFNYKQDWLRHQFENGLVIKKITSPKEGFIEYIEAEHSWKPVYAPGYILIHHLHVPEDYSDQSIFIDYHVHEMRRVFRDMGFDVQLKKLDSAQDAWESGSPHGTFGVFMDEYFLTHKILNKKEIELLVGSLELDEVFIERNYPGEKSV